MNAFFFPLEQIKGYTGRNGILGSLKGNGRPIVHGPGNKREYHVHDR